MEFAALLNVPKVSRRIRVQRNPFLRLPRPVQLLAKVFQRPRLPTHFRGRLLTARERFSRGCLARWLLASCYGACVCGAGVSTAGSLGWSPNAAAISFISGPGWSNWLRRFSKREIRLGFGFAGWVFIGETEQLRGRTDPAPEHILRARVLSSGAALHLLAIAKHQPEALQAA